MKVALLSEYPQILNIFWYPRCTQAHRISFLVITNSFVSLPKVFTAHFSGFPLTYSQNEVSGKICTMTQKVGLYLYVKVKD